MQYLYRFLIVISAIPVKILFKTYLFITIFYAKRQQSESINLRQYNIVLITKKDICLFSRLRKHNKKIVDIDCPSCFDCKTCACCRTILWTHRELSFTHEKSAIDDNSKNPPSFTVNVLLRAYEKYRIIGVIKQIIRFTLLTPHYGKPKTNF